MADIRIKDLATLESASLTGDVFVIDGTTGTRKLNAFSPTFGGNATVTGTLTVNGTGNSVFGGKVRWGNTAYPGYNAYLSEASTDSQLYPAIARNLVGSTGTGYTIANGELGAYCGFEFRVGDIRWFGATGTFTTGQTVTPVESMRLVSAGNLLIGTTTDNGQKLQVNGTATVLATTASTTTSTGALVVSGGVGVAGAIYAGGNITIDKAAPDFTLTRSANTNSGLIQLTTSTTYDFAIGLRNTTDSDLHIYNYGTSNDALKIARATSAVTLNSTTASTSTSSGALVVSGGVGVAKNASIGVNNSTGVLRICDNSFGSDYVVLTTAGTDATGTYGLFISQASGTGLNAPTGQMASLRVNNAAIVSANSAGPILQLTGTAPTLTGNSSLTFEFTSNTSLTLKMRGSDGVTRSASITFS